MRFVRRIGGEKAQRVGGTAFNGQTLALNGFRQFGKSLLNAVLHFNLCHIRVSADGKGDAERIRTGVFGGRIHVKHVFNTVDFLFKRNTDGFGNNLGTSAGIGGTDHNHRRRNFRIKRYRQREYRDKTGQCQNDGNYHRKTRSFNEYSGEHSYLPSVGVTKSAFTFCPVRTFCKPWIMTLSSSFKPLLTICLSPITSPRTTRRCSAMLSLLTTIT